MITANLTANVTAQRNLLAGVANTATRNELAALRAEYRAALKAGAVKPATPAPGTHAVSRWLDTDTTR